MAKKPQTVATLKLDENYLLVADATRGEDAIDFWVHDNDGKIQKIKPGDAHALAAMITARK